MTPDLESFLLQEGFSMLDRHFAREIRRRANEKSVLVGHAAALASALLRHGHVCLDLARPPNVADSEFPTLEPWPSIGTWRAELACSDLVAIDEPAFLPLVLDRDNRLYLHRYEEYERRLADAIRTRSAAGRLQVVVGGPGTGKTTRILAELIARTKHDPVPLIMLAAPTGKAAHRMEESLRSGLARLEVPEDLRMRVPRSASTLHRLLGARNDSAFFRHNADNPLPADVVIIDEASMVDLPLMAKLLDALKPSAELVLVGDPHQLASVEAGAVLADIATAAAMSATLAPALITLHRQYRYGATSGIGQLCTAIREGDGEQALALLTSEKHGDIRLRALPQRAALGRSLRAASAIESLRTALVADAPASILDQLGRSRILSPLRRGPYGVETLNEIIENLLDEEGIIRANGVFYARRPIVLTRNDHDLQLFNGDSGVIFAASPGDFPIACFATGDVTPRSLPANRLPPHETAYAMTVHRSQGSEFDRVLILLPPGSNPIVTRELLYTAVSRARQDVEIWGDPATLLETCRREVARTSGLVERLR